jgi:hypothetical protein
MNENLIQALNAYTSSLEQQLAALEARMQQLEGQLVELKSLNETANQQIVTLQSELSTLTSNPIAVSKAEEPEVEIELILDEETEVAEETKEEQAQEKTADNVIPVTEVLIVAEELKEVIETMSLAESDEDDMTAVPSKDVEEVPIVAVVNETPQDPPQETEGEVEVQIEEKTEESELAEAPTVQAAVPGPSVKDIRQAIALGDRFLFQRELFAGNGEQMQRTLDDLNGLQTMQEAMNYISQNFDWDFESTAAELFVNVLKRRFN